MKKQHKAAISFALALIFALVSLPASALPRFEAKAEMTPAWTVPEGFNAHDYTKCVTFLEQTDENGVKNGEKLSETYNPNDPETWGVNRDWTYLPMDGPAPDEPCFIWRSVNGEQRIRKINVGGKSLVGPLDISGCIDLVKLNCANCGLTELDLSSNTELGALKCSYNSLAELDLSNNTALGRLACDHNNLSELDISNNTHISRLSCHGNRLTELDLSNTNIHMNPYIMIKAEGDGYIGFDDYFYSMHQFGVYLYAYPANGVYGPAFEGFYRESGELISHGWYSEWEEAYIYYNETSEKWPPDITVIARFSDELPYNAHDFEKCRAFLEQTDENGVKNGDKINTNYDPNDPETWCVDDYNNGLYASFRWTPVNGELRISSISLELPGLGNAGMLDLSDCTALEHLHLWLFSIPELNVSGCTALERLSFENTLYLSKIDASGCTALNSMWLFENYGLAELDVTGCTALEYLFCGANELTELDVTSCSALVELYCYGNNLTELDVTGCPALAALHCGGNSLTELDLSQNTALEMLLCYGNNLTELDLSNNPMLAYDYIRAEGSGFIDYCYGGFSYPYDGGVAIYTYRINAYPTNGAEFEGFYDENGALVSEGESCGNYYCYVFRDEDQWYDDDYEIPTGTIIARFSGGYTPGDLDGNGSVSIVDAITTLRLAMGLLDGSGLNTDAADMDGNGSITLSDAIIILRMAMGLN